MRPIYIDRIERLKYFAMVAQIGWRGTVLKHLTMAKMSSDSDSTETPHEGQDGSATIPLGDAFANLRLSAAPGFLYSLTLIVQGQILEPGPFLFGPDSLGRHRSREKACEAAGKVFRTAANALHTSALPI